VTATPADDAAWLAVIDMQRIFATPGSVWLTPRFAEVIGPVRTLVGAFGPRVAWTRFLAPAEPAGRWVDYYRRWPSALLPPSAPEWDIVDELADLSSAGGLHVDATTFGKWTPELAAAVGPAGRLVLAGVSTDCCVLSTALAAADAGVAVQVVRDACAGVDDESHERALATMALYGPLIEVISLADVTGGAGG
jgi:nicotinamidase-related amidase